MMTDPIADMLTRIRNALTVKHPSVAIPLSRTKEGIVEVLKREGFIEDFEVIEKMGRKNLLVRLRYHGHQEPVIEGLERVSRPGRRVYVDKARLPSVRGGLGIAILTTSRGIMTDAEAREAGVGGEVICNVW
jgi:small subunit ribosomal protein S8